jgi:ankyrin repeat protein
MKDKKTMDPMNGTLSPLSYSPQEKGISRSAIEEKIDACAVDVLIKTKDEIQTTIPFIAARNVSEILKLYAENENEPDIDLEMEEELDRVLTSNLCEMPSDSIFVDTDLIILKDAYKGSMPINGIKEKDFKEITLLFSKICEGDSKLKISNNTPEYVILIKEAIKILLTREIGRNLLTKICNRETDLPILILDNNGCDGCFSDSSIKIGSAFNDIGFIEMHPSGKHKLNTRPLYIILGHELIHTLHPDLAIDLRTPPSMQKEFDNMEEQMTIVGLRKNLSLNTNSEIQEPIPKNNYNEYNELNERNLTAAFTGGRNIWYPRSHHHSPVHNKEGDIKRHIASLIWNNVLYDLEKLLEDKTIDLNEILSPESPLNIASMAGSLDVLKFLIKIDPAGINTKSKSGNTPFWSAVNSYIRESSKDINKYKYLDNTNYIPTLEVLYKAKSDINITDDIGNNIFHYMLKSGDKEGMRKFLEWGGNAHLENNKGQTAIEYAWEDAIRWVWNPNILSTLYETIKAIASEKYIFEHKDSLKLLQRILNFCENEFSLAVFESYFKYKQDTKDELGNTFLHYMLSSGNIEGIKKVLEIESNLKLKNEEGLTPIELTFKRLNEKFSGLIYVLPCLRRKVEEDSILVILKSIKYIQKDFLYDEETLSDITTKIFKIGDPEFALSFLKSFNINNKKVFSALISNTEFFELDNSSADDFFEYCIKMIDLNEKNEAGDNYLHQITLQSNKYPFSWPPSTSAKKMHSHLLKLAEILLTKAPFLAKEKNSQGKLPADLIKGELPADLIKGNEVLKESLLSKSGNICSHSKN